MIKTELGFQMPMYDEWGCYFMVQGPDHCVSTASLETFTDCLAKYISRRRNGADLAIELEELWKFAHEGDPVNLSA